MPSLIAAPRTTGYGVDRVHGSPIKRRSPLPGAFPAARILRASCLPTLGNGRRASGADVPRASEVRSFQRRLEDNRRPMGNAGKRQRIRQEAKRNTLTGTTANCTGKFRIWLLHVLFHTRLAPDETALHLRRKRIRYSLEDAEEVALCEAAGAHCLDAYELPEGAANFIRIADGFFQGEPLAKFLSGLHDPESSDAFDWIEAMERRPRQRSQLPAAADLRDQLSSFRRVGEDERARARGFRCASAARRFLDLTRRDRLPSVEEVANRFEAPEFETPPTSRGLRALVSSVSEIVNVHLSDTVLRQGKTAWLFALGRALGEGLANPTAPRAVVNDLRNASRQAANRAFASAFLAPIDEILAMREDDMESGAIAAEFDVSEQVTQRQIENFRNIDIVCGAACNAT